MPQTEEHLQIFAYLGMKRLVVALTKSDLDEHSAMSLIKFAKNYAILRLPTRKSFRLRSAQVPVSRI